ncbi:hypothetical protein KSP40_PGU015311 [Platanthera guangdongensis]|uniref:Uncharacterized protein n=1 Tax=Platanthera guangdongensis TaxID=2320717 RepID=A0ABR2MJ14_9ASPA
MGGNGANAAGDSFVYPPSDGVCPKRRSKTLNQMKPQPHKQPLMWKSFWSAIRT